MSLPVWEGHFSTGCDVQTRALVVDMETRLFINAGKSCAATVGNS